MVPSPHPTFQPPFNYISSQPRTLQHPSTPNLAPFQATKGLAAEYGPHQIRVNAICPLLSGTGLFEQFTGEKDTPEARAKFLFNVPMGRLCDPSDIASAALYLASDEARFVRGVCLKVDGGKCV